MNEMSNVMNENEDVKELLFLRKEFVQELPPLRKKNTLMGRFFNTDTTLSPREEHSHKVGKKVGVTMAVLSSLYLGNAIPKFYEQSTHQRAHAERIVSAEKNSDNTAAAYYKELGLEYPVSLQETARQKEKELQIQQNIEQKKFNHNIARGVVVGVAVGVPSLAVGELGYAIGSMADKGFGAGIAGIQAMMRRRQQRKKEKQEKKQAMIDKLGYNAVENALREIPADTSKNLDLIDSLTHQEVDKDMLDMIHSLTRQEDLVNMLNEDTNKQKQDIEEPTDIEKNAISSQETVGIQEISTSNQELTGIEEIPTDINKALMDAAMDIGNRQERSKETLTKKGLTGIELIILETDVRDILRGIELPRRLEKDMMVEKTEKDIKDTLKKMNTKSAMTKMTDREEFADIKKILLTNALLAESEETNKEEQTHQQANTQNTQPDKQVTQKDTKKVRKNNGIVKRLAHLGDYFKVAKLYQVSMLKQA